MTLDWSANVPAWATIISIVGTAAATFGGVLLAFYLERRSRARDRRSGAAGELRGLFDENHRAGNLANQETLLQSWEYPFSQRSGVIRNGVDQVDPGCGQWALAVSASLTAAHSLANVQRDSVYADALAALKLWERGKFSSADMYALSKSVSQNLHANLK